MRSQGRLLMPTRFGGQGRQLDPFLDGMHAFAMILLEQLRLALVLGPDGQHADADAHDDGHDGNEDGDNSRIHDRFLRLSVCTPLIPARPESGCSGCLQPAIPLGSIKGVQAAVNMNSGARTPIPTRSAAMERDADLLAALRPWGPARRARRPHGPLPPEGHAPGRFHRAQTRPWRRTCPRPHS